jgi:uncharacterized protein YpuA (DUF1002 family)
MKVFVRKYNATGQADKTGIPHGLAGMGKEIDAARARASKKAKEIVSKMIENEQVSGDDPRAVTSLEELVAIVVAKVKVEHDGKLKEVYVNQARDRISAAKAVLEFTKQKPAAKVDMKVQSAEDWLKTLK